MDDAENSYAVELDYGGPFANDLGEMTETHLFAYLKNRHLLARSPEEVLEELQEKDSLIVEFGEPSGEPTQVNIRRVSRSSES